MKPPRAVLRCVILMLLVSLGISAGSSVRYNQYLTENFVPNDTTWPLFCKGVPIEEIYWYYLDSDGYADSTLTLFSVDIELDRPIRYYHTPDLNSQPAVEISPGRYRIAIGEPDFDQGFNTLPTYQKGWRYARTLPEALTSKNEDRAFFQSPMRWYYVRLEDLKWVQLQLRLQGEMNWLKIWSKNMEALASPITYWKSLWEHTDLYELDNMMYEDGDYLSPDLFKPLWDWKCTALSIGIVLLLIPERLLARRENRRQPSGGS